MTAKIEGKRKRKRPKTRTYFIRRVYFTKIVYFVKKETENIYYMSILSIVFYCNEIFL